MGGLWGSRGVAGGFPGVPEEPRGSPEEVEAPLELPKGSTGVLPGRPRLRKVRFSSGNTMFSRNQQIVPGARPRLPRGSFGGVEGGLRGTRGVPGALLGRLGGVQGPLRLPRCFPMVSRASPEGSQGSPRGPPWPPKGSQGPPRGPQGSPEGPKRAPETPQEPPSPPEAPPKGSPGAKGRTKDSQGRSWGGVCAQNMYILIVFRVVFVCYRFRPGLTCPLGAAQTGIECFVIVIP